MGRLPTTCLRAVSATSLRVTPSGSTTLNRKSLASLMLYWTRSCASTMFSSPVIMRDSAGAGVLPLKPSSSRLLSSA